MKLPIELQSGVCLFRRSFLSFFRVPETVDLEPGGLWIHLELWVPCGGHTTYMWISLSIDDTMQSNDVPVFYTK